MSSIKRLNLLVLFVCILLVATTLIGIFWQGEDSAKIVTAIDGREVELLGRGAYANHSILRAASYIGADLTMLLIVLPLLLITNSYMRKSNKSLLVMSGVLMIVLYYSISLTFGAAINQFFLLYIVLFSLAGFTFTYAVYLSGKTLWRMDPPQGRNLGTSVFLLLAGASALIWLTMLIPAIISGDYSELIDINTTEPTFVLDIGIIFPIFTACAVALLKGREFGFRFAPTLLTFYSLVGTMVAIQTMVQQRYGIEIPLPQMIGLVVSFIVLGIIALILNIRFMKKNISSV
jgi:hypothetical protein